MKTIKGHSGIRLLIHCLLSLPLLCFAFGPSFVLSGLSSFSIISPKKRGLIYSFCRVTVSVLCLFVAVDWCVVCDCDISTSY